MINWQSIKKILESQGKFDFKPLVIDGTDKELWAYRTEQNMFVICDADLTEISYSELKLNNIFFILSTDKKYMVLKKGICISELKKDYPEDTQFDIWIIDHIYSEIIKLDKEINGYNIINNVTFDNSYRDSTYIVLEPEQLCIKTMMEESEYWKPKKKLACYEINDGELKDTGTYYCGTFTFGYSHDTHLFLKDNEYWFNDGGILTTSPRFNEPVIKALDKGLAVIDIKKIEGTFKLCVYNIYEGWKPGYDFIECSCLGKFALDLKNKYSITEYYSYNNITFVKFLERARWKNDRMILWATFDLEGNFYYQQSTSQKEFLSFKNGIVKLMSETPQKGDEYEFYDYKGNQIVSFKKSFIPQNHVVIERYFDLSLIRNDANITEENNTICFKGIMDTRTCELIVPFSHRDLTLYNDFENFYAIFSEEYTGKDGNKQFRYGLIYNGEILLPCYCDNISAISKNIFTYERQGKHGIISNGLIRSKNVYDTIKLIEEVSTYTFSEDNFWFHTFLYKYKHAILYKGIKLGICSPKLNLFLKPTFNQVDFISEHFILADNMLYKVDDSKVTKFKSMEGYDYLGGFATTQCHYHLFYKDGAAMFDEDSYFGISLKNGKYDDDVEIVDLANTSSFIHNDLDDGVNNGDIDMDTYGPILCIDSIYYSINEKIFTNNLKDFTYPMDDNDYHDDYIDDTDYDRETYYALGGDDYDSFRENGGSIDDMMDGMGF